MPEQTTPRRYGEIEKHLGALSGSVAGADIDSSLVARAITEGCADIAKAIRDCTGDLVAALEGKAHG